MHKPISLLLLLGLTALPALAAAETYKDVSLVDVNCSKWRQIRTHTRGSAH
jgi:hypothetical protein